MNVFAASSAQVLSVHNAVVEALHIPLLPLNEVQGVDAVPVYDEHYDRGEVTHPYPLVTQVEDIF